MSLEEGAWREEVLGHFNGAVRLHEQLLEQPDIPNRVRVEAMHRLGVCYSMKGNLTPAVNLFLKLVREFPDAEPFAQKASHNLLLLSPEANPSDRSWYQDERLFLGDLALVLDAALAHSETATVREAVGEAVGSIRMMRRQLSAEDLQSVDRALQALESLEASLAGPRASAIRSGWMQSAGRVWMLDRAALFAPDDANAQVVECRDRLAKALVAQDAAEIRRQAGRAARWADPVLRSGHDSLTGDYLKLVQESTAAVAVRASDGRFREARSIWLQTTRTLNRAFGAFTLHVPGLSDFPEEIRPDLVAVLTRIEGALRAIESPDDGDDPQAAILEAVEQLGRIEGRLSKTLDQKTALPNSLARNRLRRWAEDWAAVGTTLRAGDLLRARQLLKPYEL
jgi:tetratricopeptide (TPR) repeat protein